MESVAGNQLVALSRAVLGALRFGEYKLAEEALTFMTAVAEHALKREPALRAHLDLARAHRAVFDGNLVAAISCSRDCAAAYEELGDIRTSWLVRANIAYYLGQLGAHVEAERQGREVLKIAERLGLSRVAAAVKQNLGVALLHRGETCGAIAMEREAVDAFSRHRDAAMESAARTCLARAMIVSGDSEHAEGEARLAVESAAEIPTIRAFALGVLAASLLALGRASEALEPAERAFNDLEDLGLIEEGEFFVRLVHAEALEGVGRHTDAVKAIVRARDTLFARAARIEVPEWRRTYLEDVIEHARTVKLAEAWERGA
jgi:tetratricopeptide (TPR) repeat protein